jgi:hypothetical protein
MLAASPFFTTGMGGLYTARRRVMEEDLRDEFIGRVVRGKTFAEVGGLWGTINEKVSVAHRLGAAELTMIDVTVEGGELWKLFRERMKSLGIEKYSCIVADICDVRDAQFDVIHCSGVLYHHPNPLSLIEAFRRATRGHLVLTSAITGTRVENERGVYEIPPSGVIFVPALEESERAVLDLYWREAGAEAYGITKKVAYRPDDFGPWWFLPTAQSMRAMCAACGFRTLDAGHIWNDNAYTILLEAV